MVSGDSELSAQSAAHTVDSPCRNLPVETKKCLTKKTSQKPMGVVRRKPSAEKFQFAKGFEDWGIPRYPEDYVDPAELYCASDMFDC